MQSQWLLIWMPNLAHNWAHQGTGRPLNANCGFCKSIYIPEKKKKKKKKLLASSIECHHFPVARSMDAEVTPISILPQKCQGAPLVLGYMAYQYIASRKGDRSRVLTSTSRKPSQAHDLKHPMQVAFPEDWSFEKKARSPEWLRVTTPLKNHTTVCL